MRGLAIAMLLAAPIGLRVSCDCGGGHGEPVCLAGDCGGDAGGEDASSGEDAGTDAGRLPDGGTTAADGGPSCVVTGCSAGDDCCAFDLSCHPTGCLSCCPSVQ